MMGKIDKYTEELKFWKGYFASFKTIEDYVEARHVNYRHPITLFPEMKKYYDEAGLDVGCGLISIYHDTPFRFMTAVDPLLEEYDKIFRFKNSNVNYRHNHNDDGKLHFTDMSFSFVSCINMIDHTYFHKDLLLEIRRVLVPDGLLIFHVNLEPKLTFPEHVKLWNYHTIEEEVMPLFQMLKAFIYWWEEYKKFTFWGLFKRADG